MDESFVFFGGIALAGVAFYLLLKAIARRLVKPKPAIMLAGLVGIVLCPLLGEFLLAGVVVVVCAIVDLLRSTKPVE